MIIMKKLKLQVGSKLLGKKIPKEPKWNDGKQDSAWKTIFAFKLKKKPLWFLFMDGVQLPQG